MTLPLTVDSHVRFRQTSNHRIDLDLFASPSAKITETSSPVGKWTVWGDNRRYRWTYTFFNDKSKFEWVDVFNDGMRGQGTWKIDSKSPIIFWNSGSVDLWDLPINFNGMTGIEDMKEKGKINIHATKQE